MQSAHILKTVEIERTPGHLNATARAEWNRMSAIHDDLTPSDESALAAYCTAYARWVYAEQQIQQSGPVVKNKAGNPIANPYVGVADQAMDKMHKFLSLLQHRNDKTGCF